MSTFTSHRFSISALAFAAVATVALNGTMLLGFDHLASAGDTSQIVVTRVVTSKTPTPPVVALERVVVSSRRA